jgi:hypothetical protein
LVRRHLGEFGFAVQQRGLVSWGLRAAYWYASAAGQGVPGGRGWLRREQPVAGAVSAVVRCGECDGAGVRWCVVRWCRSAVVAREGCAGVVAADRPKWAGGRCGVRRARGFAWAGLRGGARVKGEWCEPSP